MFGIFVLNNVEISFSGFIVQNIDHLLRLSTTKLLYHCKIAKF